MNKIQTRLNKLSKRQLQEICKRIGIKCPKRKRDIINKCENSEWIQTLEDNTKQCTPYTHIAENCNGERQIFTPGTLTSDSQCVNCGNSQWIQTLENGTKQCQDYTNTSFSCGDGTLFKNPTKDEQKCVVVTQQECNEKRQIFINGKCGETCGNDEYVKDNECVEYTWVRRTKKECNYNKGVFKAGTATTDQTCTPCTGSRTEIRDNKCVPVRRAQRR